MRSVTTCRVCGSTALQTYLDLGEQPLANALTDQPLSGAPRFPLRVQWCASCGLSQLTHVVPPDTLFTNYPYLSGAIAAHRDRCEEIAGEFAKPGAFVVDIGGNDGALLKAFDRHGCRVLNIDPGVIPVGIPSLQQYWSADLAAQPALCHQVDVLTAMNVVGHVDDIHDFLTGIRQALKPDGVAMFEMPHILSLFELNAFDTIYHEHLSYWSVGALWQAAERAGLWLKDLRFLPEVHGGTMRYYLSPQEHYPTPWMAYWLEREECLFQRNTYERFASRVEQTRTLLAKELRGVTHGIGAAAKTTVLLNAVQAPDLVGVFDDMPSKQGRYIPGTSVQVLSPENFDLGTLDQLVIFAWNWAPAIIARYRKLGFRGMFLVPLPKPRWIETWLHNG